MAKTEIWPVLIAGGSGTRFWPLSRKTRPKQLLRLTSEKPLVCEACATIKPLCGYDKIFISASKELAASLKKALPRIIAKNFIVEPVPRDTAPAVGLALSEISKRIDPQRPEPVLAFLPADHHIEKPAEFRKILASAASIAAKNDLIVAIGIRPGFASGSFGYIQPGAKIRGFGEARMARRFAEKPGAATARQYIRRGYLWNAGMFIARPSVLWKAFKQFQPLMFRLLQAINRAPAAARKSVLNSNFPRMPKISFDYAIMEKTKQAAVIPGDFGWSDIGGYQALGELLARGALKNLGRGRMVSINSQNLFVHTKKLAAAVGVSNLVIVETKDAILVMDLTRDAELKKLVSELSNKGMGKYL